MQHGTKPTTSEGPPFRIGVTGHRDIGASGTRAALAERVRAVFAFIWQTVVDTASPGRVPRLVVVSPLAEGADRLIAREALASGFPLHCPLPFPTDEYERDFATEKSRREYRELLARAVVIRELPGERGTPEGRGEAYAAVGRVVVGESDVLLAIWDGEAARGSGGTAQVIADALDRGLPVVWIASEAPHAVRVLTRTGGTRREQGLTTLANAIVARSRGGRV